MSLHINTQALLVAPLVASCFVYSAWTLMPAALRRRLATVLARVRWVGHMPVIARAARAQVGCGCDGCDRSTASAPPNQAAAVIRIVPRRPTP